MVVVVVVMVVLPSFSESTSGGEEVSSNKRVLERRGRGLGGKYVRGSYNCIVGDIRKCRSI